MKVNATAAAVRTRNTAIAIGTTGAVLLGAGMCLTMLTTHAITGIALGTVGITALALPDYLAQAVQKL